MNQGFRRGWRSNRTVFFLVMFAFAIGLIIASQSGLLAPIEGVASVPLNALSGMFNRIALNLSGSVVDLAEYQSLQQHNIELEAALSRFQSELVELREVADDYQRLASLLNYVNTTQGQEFVTADVINYSPEPPRSIAINRGTRDGIAIGMPVVTELGLVGRVIEVQAYADDPRRRYGHRADFRHAGDALHPAGNADSERRPGAHVRSGRQPPPRYSDRTGQQQPPGG